MNDVAIELINLSKSFDGFATINDINLTIFKGEFLTLLGPSGCGKTTLLRLISGLEQPSAGSILINGKDATALAPQERFINTVFQSYALFPHMNVFENVAFGLKCQGVPKAHIAKRVEEALSMVKLTSFAYRKPKQLSGGQQQRVAIARAVINRPFVLLLDEPLSSLDYNLRKAMQLELKQLQRQLGICFVFVTHDQEEALSMSDRIVVMSEGRIEQVGTPRQVYDEPKNLQVAKFMGEVNVFKSEVLHANNDAMTLQVEGQTIYKVKNKGQFSDKQCLNLLVRPEDIQVWPNESNAAGNPVMPGQIEEIIYKGTTVDLMIRLGNQKLIASTEFFHDDPGNILYTIGQRVWINWKIGWEVLMPYDET